MFAKKVCDFRLAMVFVFGGLGGSACGPYQYITQVTRQATTEVAAAKTAGGDRYAPYEYTMAQAYLHKSREEAGYSDYEAAIRFGKMAEEMAVKARTIALEEAGREGENSPAPAPIDPSGTPAEAVETDAMEPEIETDNRTPDAKGKEASDKESGDE